MRARWRFAALLVTLLWVIGIARAASPNCSQDWASAHGVPDVLLVRRPSIVEQGLPVSGESNHEQWTEQWMALGITPGLDRAAALCLSTFASRVVDVRPARARVAAARGPPAIV